MKYYFATEDRIACDLSLARLQARLQDHRSGAYWIGVDNPQANLTDHRDVQTIEFPDTTGEVVNIDSDGCAIVDTHNCETRLVISVECNGDRITATKWTTAGAVV